MSANAQELYYRAELRVRFSPHLEPYAKIILQDFGVDHYRWVARAKISEILDWAKSIQKDLEG
jgi:hypothetical protein